MPNPNIKALSLASKQSLGSGMRVVRIGKDSQPVNIAVMSSINSHSWRKSASYESLKRNVYSLATAHTVADLISMVSNELPQDTSAAFQEAQFVAQMVMDNVLIVGNLEPIAFLSSTGKVANIEDAINLKNRPDDISFLRFNCVVDGAAMDSRVITVKPLSFQFSLKLPQYIYDVTADTSIPVVKACITPAPSTVAREDEEEVGAVWTLDGVRFNTATTTHSTPLPSVINSHTATATPRST